MRQNSFDRYTTEDLVRLINNTESIGRQIHDLDTALELFERVDGSCELSWDRYHCEWNAVIQTSQTYSVLDSSKLHAVAEVFLLYWYTEVIHV